MFWSEEVADSDVVNLGVALVEDAKGSILDKVERDEVVSKEVLSLSITLEVADGKVIGDLELEFGCVMVLSVTWDLAVRLLAVEISEDVTALDELVDNRSSDEVGEELEAVYAPEKNVPSLL